MARLFGTDGIRGVAGEDLTAEFALRLGRAVGFLMDERRWERKVLIGCDTRISSPMLEWALGAGLMSMGVEVYSLGIVPTPVVAFLTRHLGFPLGCVISASHNPIEDNGIKFFDRRGMKLDDSLEDYIEELLALDENSIPVVTGTQIGRRHEAATAVDEYVRYLAEIGQDRLDGFTIVLDAAFGAASIIAPSVYTLLQATVIPLNCKPDGSRINVKCGATDPRALQQKVLEVSADMGIAFDGDADRAILVDEEGKIVDGDQILAMWGLHLLRKEMLPGKVVVGTLLSNKGLELALEREGGILHRSPVGDKYVLRDMLAKGAKIGGEQSGHIIFLDHLSTGDGILTGIMVALLMRETRKPLSALASQMTKFPQVQLNIDVRDKRAALENQKVKEELDLIAAEIEKMKGRLLVRPSGTESVIRVMTEAPDEAQARALAERAINVFREFSDSGKVTEI